MSVFFDIAFDYHKLIIEVFMLFSVWWLLKRETRKLKDVVVDLGDKIGELQEEVSSVQENAADETQEQNWETVKAAWSTTKAKIQHEIKTIRHKTTRERYKNFKRFTYRGIINQLKNDKRIAADIHEKLLEMDHLYRTFRRRPKKIQTEGLQRFLELYSQVTPTFENNK